MRTGCFFTATRLAQAGLIEEKYKEQCPFCNIHGPETIEHLLLACKKWTGFRNDCLSDYIQDLVLGSNLVPIDPVTLPLSLKCLLLGGSLTGGHPAANWFPKDPVMVEGRPDYSGFGCVKVAKFLQRVFPVRTRLMRTLGRPSLTSPEDQGLER
jgi:hypothetical protein